MTAEEAAGLLARLHRRWPKMDTEELGSWITSLQPRPLHVGTAAVESIIASSSFPPNLERLLAECSRRDSTPSPETVERDREEREYREHASERAEIAVCALRRMRRMLAEPVGSEIHRAIDDECDRNVDPRRSVYGRPITPDEPAARVAAIGLGTIRTRPRLVRRDD